MIPISEALQIIEKQTNKLSTETIDSSDSVGRILAEAICADMDLPPFNRSQMDGFALKSKDTTGANAKLKIIGESAAGAGFDKEIKRGEAVKIMTGARIPDGADAVQKVELTKEEKGFVVIAEPTKLQQHIVNQGEEIKKGKKIFQSGERINANMIAVLASFGYARVKVFQKPNVSLLATGSEIVEITEKPKRDQIRNSNSIALKILAEQCGATAKILSSVKDNISDLKSQIAEAVSVEVERGKSQIPNPKSRILIITGGVSVGDYDFTKPVLRELGADFFFERVALRPGKPTVFARLNDTLIFGLPGNPVSAAVTFLLFVRRAILQMQGAADCDLKEGWALLSNFLKGAKERDSFIPARLNFNDRAQVLVEPLRWSGSSDFVAFSKADCLIYVPQDKIIEAGGAVKILFL